jgi:oxygen-independent coproporphyrinogen-3 oxidase
MEILEKHQSLTDFCYTALRLQGGLSVEKLVQKFGSPTLDLIKKIAAPLIERGFMSFENQHYRLTDAGVLISNQVFEKFAFLAEDLA